MILLRNGRSEILPLSARIGGQSIPSVEPRQVQDLAEIPEHICNRIHAEEDAETLRRWHKAAAKTKNFGDFLEKMI